MNDTRIAALQDMPIFGGLRPDVLAALIAGARMVDMPKGGFFFHQDDDAASMFVLEAGEVAVLRRWEGQHLTLGHLREGDCFGEMALIDLFPRSATVQAVEACNAIELSTASFQALAQLDIEQFALLQMNIARELSRRLRVADDRFFHAHVYATRPDLEYSFLLT
jgi:CRP/FNR family cyclic AMP-dependent transcriptional regulator